MSVVWAGGYVAAGTAVGPEGGFGPLWLTGSRLLLAGSLLTAFARHRAVSFPARSVLPSILASGVLAWLGGSGMQTIGQQTVPAGTTALVLGAGPLVALGLASLRERRPPTVRDAAVVAMGLVGLCIAVGPAGTGPGLGWVIAACICWTAASVWESWRGDSGGHPLAVGGLQMLAGGVAVCALALATAEPAPTPSLEGWLGFGWLAIPCAAVGMPLWLYVLRSLPVSIAMTQSTLTPVAAAVLSTLLLGEPMGLHAIVGGAVVLWAAWVAVQPTAPLPLPALEPAPVAAR